MAWILDLHQQILIMNSRLNKTFTKQTLTKKDSIFWDEFLPSGLKCSFTHGKATVLEGKVSIVAILSDHHGGCQLWHLITFKSLEWFWLLIPHLKDLIYICLESENQGYRKTFKFVLGWSIHPQKMQIFQKYKPFYL